MMELPIDQGWAWVVTFACGGMFAWTIGNEKNRGIIFVELAEIYPEKSATAIMWIFSLAQLVNRLSGPLCGMLLARTSARFAGMLGVGIMASCMAAFAHVPSIEYMYVVYGVLYGCGNGMVMLTVLTAFAPYFEKRRALSLGLTTAGSGLGSIILPVILRKLFDSYSFSGAILLYAGVCLQTMILASLLRPFSYYSKWIKPVSDDSKSMAANEGSDSNLDINQERFGVRSLPVGANKEQPKSDSPVSELLSTSNDICSLPSHRTQPQHLSSLQILASSALSFEQIQQIAGSETVEKRSEAKRFNWQLISNPWTLILGFSALAYCSGISITAQCVPPLGKERGMSKELVSVLLSVGGALEIPMRILNGWLADKKLVSAPTQVGLCMLFMGVSALLCATIPNIAGVVIVVIGIGCAGASVFSLMPVTCEELFGKENVQSAMAINFVFMGLSNIVSTFSAGGIYDITGRWSYVFYYIGAMPIIGSLLMFTITLAVRRKHKRAEAKEEGLQQ